MKYIIKEGWQLNPNEKVVNSITKAVERNNGECPCVHPENDGNLTCPCDSYMVRNKCCC